MKLQLFFAAKWIMISEISFDAAIAHGNFSVEPDPTTVAPQVKSHNVGERHDQKIEIPVPNEINEPTIIAVILIGKRNSLIITLINGVPQGSNARPIYLYFFVSITKVIILKYRQSFYFISL